MSRMYNVSDFLVFTAVTFDANTLLSNHWY